MYLKRLEISGFKSFANKTVLDFDNGVTAIVGPNGCGKSNIVDAMKWVMGEQSMKSVRGKKGEDLIFSGSKKKVRLGKARVALCMDNADNVLPVDFPEAVISRSIFRNGENEYHLNNSRVRLKDISEILARGKMGQKSFSIINQGMADAILNYSPQERRLILEEAAGVREYQIKKDDAARTIKNTQGNLEKVASLMMEITPHLRYLRKQASKAEKREEIAGKLKDIQKKYFSISSRDFYKKKNALSKKAKSIRETIFNKSNSIIQLKKKLSKEEKDVFGGRNLASSLQQKWNDLRLKIGDLEKSVARIETRIEIAKEQGDEQVLPVDSGYIKKRISEAVKLFNEILKTKEADKKDDLADKGLKLLNSLHKEVEQGKTKKYLKKTGVDPKLLEEKKKLDGEITVLSEEADEIQAQITSIIGKESKEKKKLFALEREIRDLEDEIFRHKDDLRDMGVEEAKISMQLEEIENDIKESGLTIEDVTKAGADNTVPRNDVDFDSESAEREIRRLKVQLDEIGGIDPSTIQEFKETNERYEFLEKESEDLKKSIGDLKEVIFDLEKKIHQSFNEYFSVINDEFNNYFRLIFGGGRASLLRKTISGPNKDSDDIAGDNSGERENEIREGVDISAVLPGKKIKDLSLFSGGERSLTSIAMLFAIIASATPPFLMLDEIDAALDENNSQKFGNILQELSQKTQFILITHNRETMKLANTLYGVTMDDGVSRLLSIKLT